MKWSDETEELDISSQVMCVDVGGVLFYTSVKTLKKSPYFEKELSNDIIKNQYIFIDRDPSLFNYVLIYLRTGIVPSCEEKFTYDTLKEDSKFFKLKDMERLLTAQMKTEKNTMNDLVYEIKQLRLLLQSQKSNIPRTRSQQEWSH